VLDGITPAEWRDDERITELRRLASFSPEKVPGKMAARACTLGGALRRGWERCRFRARLTEQAQEASEAQQSYCASSGPCSGLRLTMGELTSIAHGQSTLMLLPIMAHAETARQSKSRPSSGGLSKGKLPTAPPSAVIARIRSFIMKGPAEK
jgi:hypothetical protein